MNWKNIRPARIAARVRQVDLAAELLIAQATVSRFEGGMLPVSAKTVSKILSAIEKLAASRKKSADFKPTERATC